MSARLLELLGPTTPLTHFMAEELRQVDRIFRAQLESDLPPVNRLCSYIERYRGKMLRPALTLLSGVAASPVLEVDALPELSESHRTVAAVVEMIHMATLVHDDVLDEASVRRQGATVNYLHGNEAAVLLGDYLISNAFHLCSTLGRPEINRRIGQVTNATCAGELLQLHHRQHWSIDEATYYTIIERKTAALIGVCCELGASLSGAPGTIVSALSEYGRRVGIAFQIQDDLLDLSGEEATVGKNVAKDLEKSKLTLPLILYLRAAGPVEREEMLSFVTSDITPPVLMMVRDRLTAAGCINSSRIAANAHINAARDALSQVTPGPGRQMLADLADLLASRSM